MITHKGGGGLQCIPRRLRLRRRCELCWRVFVLVVRHEWKLVSLFMDTE
jgi:hypothetical protein